MIFLHTYYSRPIDWQRTFGHVIPGKHRAWMQSLVYHLDFGYKKALLLMSAVEVKTVFGISLPAPFGTTV